MKMEGESMLLKTNLTEWRFCLYPKYILLPIDENHDQVKNNVKNIIYSEVTPRPLEHNIRLVCASDDALINILDMDPNIMNSQEFVEFIAGRKLPYGALPVAHRYGGHQYGLWVGQLGDGRAHILGEYIDRLSKRWQIQLKGSGQTPYSRSFDGRAVLRSCIREMIASEAMYHLGVPTTRSAAVVGTFPDIHLTDDNRYIRLFSEIAHRTLDLVAKWQGLGFTHGLLNTDNMSLLGVTLDYGPFGFVDSYDSGFVANYFDGEGRYALGKQPDVVVWNIGQLANALEPLLTPSQQMHLSHILKTLDTYSKNKILEIFLMKIGLKKERWGDEELVEKLLDMMQQTGADFTATFRQLSELQPQELSSELKLGEKWSLKRLSSHICWGCWLDQYRNRLDKEAADTSNATSIFEDERKKRMLSVNPAYVPRNWLLHEAIADAERDDFEKVRFLLQVLKNPYEVQPEAELRGFSSQPPFWAYELKISCSS